jgi:hypothetical protein
MLLAAGGIEVLALLALVPDVVAGSGWLAPTSARHANKIGHLALMRDDAQAPGTSVSHHSRRHS